MERSCIRSGRIVERLGRLESERSNALKRIPDLVPGITCVLKNFFWMVVSGTNCSQKNFENFFGAKKGI
jgi:hypothetical protein